MGLLTTSSATQACDIATPALNVSLDDRNYGLASTVPVTTSLYFSASTSIVNSTIINSVSIGDAKSKNIDGTSDNSSTTATAIPTALTTTNTSGSTLVNVPTKLLQLVTSPVSSPLIQIPNQTASDRLFGKRPNNYKKSSLLSNSLYSNFRSTSNVVHGETKLVSKSKFFVFNLNFFLM